MIFQYLGVALAASGEIAAGTAAAVVAAILLSSKPSLHRWLGSLRCCELAAGLHLLLLSVVVLPLLPDQGQGPWQVVNPYRIQGVVVLSAAMSFLGYFVVEVAGARKGPVFTDLFGGLASSTAATFHLSRLARDQHRRVSTLATGILLACETMLRRVVVVLLVVASAVLSDALVPLVLMSLVILGLRGTGGMDWLSGRTKLRSSCAIRWASGRRSASVPFWR